MASEPVPARTPEREQFYGRIAPANLAPLWENLHRMVTPEPVASAVPAIWHYRDVRPHLMESGSLITAQEATRRVLMLMNPGLGGEASITGSLFAGLQLIMPCEIGAPDPYHGYKLRYVNPASGEFAMPTIATFVQLMPAGFASQLYRSTDGTVFVVVEGKGETRIGDKTFAWEPHDIFVVPSWMTHAHHPGREAVLFSFSDRVVQEKLGLWREARGNA